MLRWGHLIKKFAEVSAVNDVSLSILQGQMGGIIGHSGAGKTTLLVLGSLWRTGFFDVAMMLKGLSKIGHVLHFLLPPAHHGWLGEFAYAMLETLAMAFIGTLFAAIVAVPLGYLGAKNMVPQWLFHIGLRRFLDGVRGVDTLIWALMFVHVVGLGPFAGILALAVSDTGTLAKLYAGAIENVDIRFLDGIQCRRELAPGRPLWGLAAGVAGHVQPCALLL